MRKVLLAGASLTLAFIGTPALADTRGAANDWEKAYIALNVVDLVQTRDCLHRGLCEEGNPLMGRNPSDVKLVLGKALLVGLQFAIFEHVKQRNPKAALRIAQVGVGLTGATVALNARFTF